jgi:phospholipid/cholesterol/gamma-HCH transport system substrate-binding protein
MSTNSNKATTKTKLKVGLFSLSTLVLLGALSVYVNNRPFWWKPCEPVLVTVEDATGLKTKAPVKSLGLDVGFIQDLAMVESGVKLKICLTAPVEVVPDTKAFVRSEGFMGDRFLELKPVKYIGKHKLEQGVPANPNATPTPESTSSSNQKPEKVIPEGRDQENSSKPSNSSRSESGWREKFLVSFSSILMPSAQAQTEALAQMGRSTRTAKEVPIGEGAADMQQVMGQLNDLTKSLKESINPDEIRSTIKQLNATLKDASKAFSPQGGLTATAQRSLIKLEDAIEQLRDQATRINQGQGSVGMLLNDPYYAEELRKAVSSINKLLGRASELKLVVNLGFAEMNAWGGSRAAFQLSIWPRPHRYYTLGVSNDPRGNIAQTTNQVESGGTTNTIRNTSTTQGGFSYTLLIGQVFWNRVDFALGLVHGDGVASFGLNLGWNPEKREQLQLKADAYFRGAAGGGTGWTVKPDARIYSIFQFFSAIYVTGGVEGLRKVNGTTSLFYGAGLRFEDEDIKLLFSFL